MKIPDSLISLIKDAWTKPTLTAECILRQSDFYIENPRTTTPWDKEYVRKAQLAYYLPLNLVRNLRVFTQLKNNPTMNCDHFFSDLENYWELGSGLGPSFFALKEIFPNLSFSNINFIETSKFAQDLHKELLAQTLLNQKASRHQHFNWSNTQPSSAKNNLSKDLIVCSFALTELDIIPEWLFKAKALVIIEPATREDGRKLLQFRARLIAEGFQIWSPCLHQMDCPLLQETKNDWCHDRVHFEKPEELQKIEDLLPIKNNTLTLSYLIAKKKNPNLDTDIHFNSETDLLRVVGDFLNEKGKTRQMICRNSKREFLTQLKRANPAVEFARGDILKLEGPTKLIGNEIRVDNMISRLKTL